MKTFEEWLEEKEANRISIYHTVILVIDNGATYETSVLLNKRISDFKRVLLSNAHSYSFDALVLGTAPSAMYSNPSHEIRKEYDS